MVIYWQTLKFVPRWSANRNCYNLWSTPVPGCLVYQVWRRHSSQNCFSKLDLLGQGQGLWTPLLHCGIQGEQTCRSLIKRKIKIKDKSSAHLRTGKFALVLQICLFFRELITSMDCFLLWRPWMNNQPWKPKTEGLHIDQNPFHKYKTKIWCSILSWSTFVTIIYFQDGSSMRPGNDTTTICE